MFELVEFPKEVARGQGEKEEFNEFTVVGEVSISV
jgi:hypothetical protein